MTFSHHEDYLAWYYPAWPFYVFGIAVVIVILVVVVKSKWKRHKDDIEKLRSEENWTTRL